MGVAVGMAVTVIGVVSGWLASVAPGLVYVPVRGRPGGRAAVTFVGL